MTLIEAGIDQELVWWAGTIRETVSRPEVSWRIALRHRPSGSACGSAGCARGSAARGSSQASRQTDPAGRVFSARGGQPHMERDDTTLISKRYSVEPG